MLIVHLSYPVECLIFRMISIDLCIDLYLNRSETGHVTRMVVQQSDVMADYICQRPVYGYRSPPEDQYISGLWTIRLSIWIWSTHLSRKIHVSVRRWWSGAGPHASVYWVRFVNQTGQLTIRIMTTQVIAERRQRRLAVAQIQYVPGNCTLWPLYQTFIFLHIHAGKNFWKPAAVSGNTVQNSPAAIIVSGGEFSAVKITPALNMYVLSFCCWTNPFIT